MKKGSVVNTMPNIILKNITKRFGKSVGVNNLNLEINDGDFVTLLGPSGCGKTTTLRMIAGLESPTEGEIYIGDKLVFSHKKGIDLSPDKRNIGFLFQNYALWPHLTTYKNIAFGLENLKWDKKRISDRVQELLQMMNIAEYADRYPSELSGGQQQRVAIARTLATNPSILLMDEPLSNLDAKLRMSMRAELKRLHNESGSTFVYVTHDQQEAMALSTRVCLIKKGVLQQYSTPLELYGNPVNEFVADFVGSPSINLIPLKASASGVGIQLTNDDLSLTFVPGKQDFQIPQDKSEVKLGIRPEMLHIVENGGIPAKIVSSFPYGMETVVSVEIGSTSLNLVVFGNVDFKPGEVIRLTFEGDKYVLFDAQSQEELTLGTVKI